MRDPEGTDRDSMLRTKGRYSQVRRGPSLYLGFDGGGPSQADPVSLPGLMGRIATVAYDEAFAARIRKQLAGQADLTEQKMFGGLAFLIGGNMAVAASGQGGVLVRVDPEQSDALVATTNARPMEMRGKPMRGWLRVDADDARTKPQLAKWVELGAMYARSLPAKR